MPEEKEHVLNEEEESDGTASDDSSEKDGDSDEQLNDENSILSSESKHKEEEEKRKKAKKAKKEKTKKKSKKKKEKKDKKEKDKKKKKLPPVQAPDYVHVEPRHSAHSRVSMVSAVTIPKPLQKIAKNHTGPPPKDLDYPPVTDLERDVSNITLPKTLTIGGGDLIDDSQRSGRVSLLEDDSSRSAWRTSLNQDTSLLDG